MEPEAQRIRDLAEEYITQVELPLTKPLQQYVLCPVGITASGKTTVIKPLSQMLSLVRISGDEIRFFLSEKGYGWGSATKISYIVAKHFAKQGYSIAIDSDCADTEKAAEITSFAKEIHARVVWIHINPPEEYIINKIRNYSGPKLFGSNEAVLKNFESRKHLHETLDYPFVYTFDTSKDTVNKQIEEAIGIIQNITKNNNADNRR